MNAIASGVGACYNPAENDDSVKAHENGSQSKNFWGQNKSLRNN